LGVNSTIEPEWTSAASLHESTEDYEVKRGKEGASPYKPIEDRPRRSRPRTAGQKSTRLLAAVLVRTRVVGPDRDLANVGEHRRRRLVVVRERVVGPWRRRMLEKGAPCAAA
jgi:hypothetical protein